MSELQGRTAVVTGARRGIGLAICRRLGTMGARVVMVSRDAAGLDRSARALAEEGLDAIACPADLRQPLSQDFGPVDVLVHGAADPPPFTRSMRVGPEQVDEAMTLTVGAGLALAQQVLPGMRARGFGRLVFLGSAAAHLGGPGQLAYASAKAALVGMVRTLAVEHGRHGITANLLVPGLIDTERTREAVSEDARARVVAATANRRVGTPDEVAWMVGALAAPAAGFVQGAVLDVSGGLGLGGGLL